MVCDEHGFSLWGIIAHAIGNCILFAHAITLPIAHAIIPKLHSKSYDYAHTKSMSNYRNMNMYFSQCVRVCIY